MRYEREAAIFIVVAGIGIAFALALSIEGTLKTSADEDCFAYKSTTLVVVRYSVGTSTNCFAETDSLLTNGYKIVAVTPDVSAALVTEGRIYLVPAK